MSCGVRCWITRERISGGRRQGFFAGGGLFSLMFSVLGMGIEKEVVMILVEKEFLSFRRMTQPSLSPDLCTVVLRNLIINKGSGALA